MPPQRRWIKLWVTECLEGSIRYQLSPDKRSVWYDLILFAALGTPAGQICDRDQRPLPHSFIASRLNITEALLEATLNACKAEGRISENEQGIHITHWDRYQSEYDRQKPYRQKSGAEQADPDKFIKGPLGHMVQR